MIDTHCHLLPGLDDGTRSAKEALSLARDLVQAGVTTVVCTPHRSRRFPTDMAVARERLAEMKAEVANAGVPLELRLGAEVSPAFAISLDGAALAEVTIGTRHLLVELEPATPAHALETIFESLRAHELVPVFAHPERCRSVVQDPGPLAAVREAGALVQVVATSVAGAWGGTVQRAALALFDADHSDTISYAEFTIAYTKGVKLPDQLGMKEQANMTKMKALSGERFDKSYMSDMVKDHENDIEEFKMASKQAKAAEIRDFATKTLPTLEEHLAIVKKLNVAVNETLMSPTIRETLTTFGAEPLGGSPQEFAGFVTSESKKWSEIIRLSGVRID